MVTIMDQMEDTAKYEVTFIERFAINMGSNSATMAATEMLMVA